MDVDAYLERIGYSGSREATAETLSHLHRSHLLSVPFENLDIALGRRIVPSVESFFDKIVSQRRGGFCYELNGLFGWLLKELRFPVTMLSARVCDGELPGPEFDHLVLLVKLEKDLLADVGFGDSFLEPLPMKETAVHQDSAYRVTGLNPELALERRRGDAGWQREYVFSLTPRRLADFSGMCDYHQTDPASNFTRRTLCSLATPTGRVTLSGRRAIVTTASAREERDVADEEEYRGLLRTWFGIDLRDRILVQKLFASGVR
jgi:N-hydroxyarylamine O-acetyltransferase